MARPRKEQTLQAISIRLPDAMLAEIDACASALTEETPLLEVTRTDAVRYLIQLGLQEFSRRGSKTRRRS